MSLEQDFASQRVWAVIGVSSNPEKYGNKIFRQLVAANYKVYGVNPRLEALDGHKIYPTLASLPEVPEVVNLVVPPKLGVEAVEDCIKLGVKRVWFQPGAESDEAITKAEAAGLQVLANACILLTHQTWDEAPEATASR